jgi:protoporphyrinogen IX oxidase
MFDWFGTEMLGSAYLWVKAAHVVFVIFWMAGLFMLPRFLVYHQEAAPGSADEKLWAHREARLIAIIMNPAMVAVWALGLALVINIGASGEGWFRGKFLVVIGLTVFHMWMVNYARKLAAGQRTASGRTLRLLNEIPSLATIAIVILVIVRPF